MQNVRDHFNDRVKRGLRGFIARAGLVSGICFGLGNAGFIVKDYLQHRTPHLPEQVSGGLFLGMSMLLLGTDRRPRLKVPAGILGLLGTTALGYGALGQVGAKAQILAASTSAALTLTMIFEKGINRFAHAMAETGKGFLKKVFTPLAKYPVATTGAIDLLFSTLPMGYAAIARHDHGLKIMAGLWILGGFGLISTDDSVKAFARVKPKALQPRMSHIS
jgi:hypothetical protein